MRSLFLFLIFTVMLFNSHAFAQEKKFNFSLTGFRFPKPVVFSMENSPVSLFTTSLNYNLFTGTPFEIKQGNCSPPIGTSVHYTAFFCKMENRFHQQFNFWLKIRAGGDDGYRKMTMEK